MAIDEVGEKVEELAEAVGRLDPIRFVREFRCLSCGYGIVVNREPPQCPMCGTKGSWEPAARL